MSDVADLFEDLQAELEDSSQNLGGMLEDALENPAEAPNVVVELLEEAANRSQSVSELLVDFAQESNDVVGELSENDLFVDLGDEDFIVDLSDDILLVDPTDEEFEEILRGLDVFGIGESLGFIPSADDA